MECDISQDLIPFRAVHTDPTEVLNHRYKREKKLKGLNYDLTKPGGELIEAQLSEFLYKEDIPANQVD